MIRFFDREIDCIEYRSLSNRDSLNRADLLMYFLEGNKDAVICVYDDFINMRFMGVITYQSLSLSLTFRGAIQTDFLVLGEDMWQDAREYLKKHVENSGMNCCIPVLDKAGQLLCFAYDDSDASRELRQLRELLELPEALQFSDIYPQYRCVKIHGFNELAYFFAKYLESRNVAVWTEGALWRDFFSGQECCVPDYECLNIYAEGVWKKPCDWKENFLRTVSTEFECIDRIYEANIKSCRITNARGNIETLLGYLQEKEIILCGTGRAEQNAYDYLKGNGIEVCGFIWLSSEENGNVLFGKKIMSSLEARTTYKNAVFIECKTKNSAWGLGGVDFYDYMGYRRNEGFILLRDFLEIPESSLINLLRDFKIALTGELNLCCRLFKYLEERKISVTGYLYTTPNGGEGYIVPEADIKDIDAKTLCLIVVPEYFRHGIFSYTGEEKKKEIKRYLSENGINNYTDFFSDMNSFIMIENEFEDKFTKRWLLPKKIIIGSIEASNGNEFFRSLLDSHPTIAVMHYSDLNNNLFWICVTLAIEDAASILPIFWKMIEGNEEAIFNASAFNEKMAQLLSYGQKFTSQELFVMFHIAYMYMCGKDITGDDIRNIVIYWEPHHLARTITEECVYWLSEKNVQCNVINIVRNICMQIGSRLKYVLNDGILRIYAVALDYPNLDKKNYKQSDRLIVRFEDLKCRPREVLMEICEKWEIPWSDTLMETTFIGKKSDFQGISGFDLKPVYNTYEQFFSEFDRFRLMLINAPWQRKYGYPFVELLQFSKRELQEMFLRDFRFETMDDVELNKIDLDLKIWMQQQIREKLQKTRMIEINDQIV